MEELQAKKVEKVGCELELSKVIDIEGNYEDFIELGV